MNRRELFEKLYYRWDSEQLKEDVSLIIPLMKEYEFDPLDVRSVAYICKTCKAEFTEALFTDDYEKNIPVISKKTMLSQDYIKEIISEMRVSNKGTPIASVVNISENKWSDGEFEYKLENKALKVIGILTKDFDIEIPEKVKLSGKDHYYVDEIRGTSNGKNKTTRTVKIPDTVKKIGNFAFSEFVSLESITISSIADEIGNSAFRGCKNLTSIVIPEKMKVIGSYAFDGCTSLESISLPDSVIQLGECAFRGCKALESVRLSESLREIESYTFKDCKSLKSLVIPKSVKKIGSYAFEDCTSMESIDISDSVSDIGEFAFDDCISLKSIIIPKSLKEIKHGVFKGCESLEYIEIPETVKKIEKFAFSKCESLECISVNEKNPTFSSFEGVLYSKNKDRISICPMGLYQEFFHVPDTVTEIEDCAFDGCDLLEFIVLPDSVKSIGSYAFRGCESLEKINIPPSVKKIGEYAFADCKSLKNVNLPDSVKKTGYEAFGKQTTVNRL